MRGRPKSELVLTEPEREELVALTLRRKTAQALALRARIVLACAEGQDSKVVAARQRVTPQTVSKWRGRYVRDRLDGLLDAPRSGAPRTIDDARVISQAVDRVEAAHPELIGGAGVYPAESGHGPFIHIDSRGYRARWIGSGGGS